MAEDNDDKIDAARRRLMRIAVYVPPAVLGAVALNSAAGCQGASQCAPLMQCNPNTTCGPNNCFPVVNPCAPQACNPSTCRPRN
jgi:hypothetical protein